MSCDEIEKMMVMCPTGCGGWIVNGSCELCGYVPRKAVQEPPKPTFKPPADWRQRLPGQPGPQDFVENKKHGEGK